MNFKNLIFAFFIFFSARLAQSENAEFFEVPAKNIQFIDRISQEPISVTAYSVSYDTKFNCLDADCKVSSGNNHSQSEIKVRGEAVQTMATKIPKMPKSGPLQLTFQIGGVCRQSEKCKVTISYDKFISSTEPVIFSFDYNDEASKNKRQKHQEDGAKSVAEIEAKMGKTVSLRKPAEEFDWKKIEAEFIENRKKANPMVYSENAISKLNLSNYFCSKDLLQKISACEFHSCLYKMDVMGEKLASDVIVHGVNSSGLCAISGPVGKRYFVEKVDLIFFYDILAANSSASEVSGSLPLVIDPNQVQKIKNTVQFNGAACVMNIETKKDVVTSAVLENSAPSVCKEKKVDLLYQLEMKRLSLNFTPIKVGFPKENF